MYCFFINLWNSQKVSLFETTYSSKELTNLFEEKRISYDKDWNLRLMPDLGDESEIVDCVEDWTDGKVYFSESAALGAAKKVVAKTDWKDKRRTWAAHSGVKKRKQIQWRLRPRNKQSKIFKRDCQRVVDFTLEEADEIAKRFKALVKERANVE